MLPIKTSSSYEMVSVDEALSAIVSKAPVLGTESIDALDSAGRVLAEDVMAGGPIPPSARSAVDGYAVKSSDRGDRELVRVELAAGHDVEVTLRAGQAVRIMTGASLPKGADAVVMVEVTEERDGLVSVREDPSAGENVHRVGQDIEEAAVVLRRGSHVNPPDIGVLATIGRSRVRVYRRPRLALLATGDELVEPWEEPPPGFIRDSNRYALLAAAREAGAETVWNGLARDDEAELERVFRLALERADVVITSGGVSMGTRDLIKPLLEKLGTVHFGRVNFKPGKPLTFASVEGRLVFGLPGYPVSSLVTFEVFVRPAIVKMQGRDYIFRPRVEVELAEPLRPDRSRPEYQRAVVRWEAGRLVARTTGGQGSSRLLSMVGANALLEIRPADHDVPAGQRVPAILTDSIAVA